MKPPGARGVSQSPEIDSPKFVADEPPSRQKGGDTIAARGGTLGGARLVDFRFLNTLGKWA